MAVRIVGVTFEHHREPFGIGEARPRISWQVAVDGAGTGAAGADGWRQAGYEIEVAAEGDRGPPGRVARRVGGLRPGALGGARPELPRAPERPGPRLGRGVEAHRPGANRPS